jgi:hypothetical protein
MLLRIGLKGAKLTKWNIGRYGSKNAAIMANRRPKLCNKCP